MKENKYDEKTYSGTVNRIRDGVALSPHQRSTMEKVGLTVEDFTNQKPMADKIAIINAYRDGHVVESGCEVRYDYILFGAGSAGRYAAKHLRENGITPLCFADNDASKHGSWVDGIVVMGVEKARTFMGEQVWIACAISRPAATEIRAQLKAMGVKTKPLWECLPVCHGLPSDATVATMDDLIAGWSDSHSKDEFYRQYDFRGDPDYDTQRDPSPISELYFPDFIAHRDDEHFVDCGACDGDTVKLFLERWNKWAMITAFEPDAANFEKLKNINEPDGIACVCAAVGDHDGVVPFVCNGDYSSHIERLDSSGLKRQTALWSLDSWVFPMPPTYIKMDIEGSELQALWGARKLIKEHSPVLAICAYHESDHLWEIPLLIHAINPEYKLFLRRYAEGAFELVWYAVPLERVK